MKRSFFSLICAIVLTFPCISISEEEPIYASTWLEDIQIQYSPYHDQYYLLFVDNRPLIRDYKIIAYDHNKGTCNTIVKTKRIITRFLITENTLLYVREKPLNGIHKNLISLDLNTLDEKIVIDSVFTIEAYLNGQIYYIEDQALHLYNIVNDSSMKLFSFREIISDSDGLYYYSTDNQFKRFDFYSNHDSLVEWADNRAYSRAKIENGICFDKTDNSLLYTDTMEKIILPISKTDQCVLSDNFLFIYSPEEGQMNIFDLSNHSFLSAFTVPGDCRFSVCNGLLFFFPKSEESVFNVLDWKDNHSINTIAVPNTMKQYKRIILIIVLSLVIMTGLIALILWVRNGFVVSFNNDERRMPGRKL